MQYDWNFGRLLPYVHAFAVGTITTIGLTAVIIIVGSVMGIALGLILATRTGRLILYPIVDLLRALPPLVLLLFMYYTLSEDVIGFAVSAFWVAAIAMSLNLAAFVGDLVRAAIDNVPRAATDAGYAIGMTRRQLTRHVVLPHVVREVIPGLTVLYIGMLKMSTLASVINVTEVVYTAQTVISEVTRSLEVWTVVGAIFVVLVVPATYAARRIERWVGRGPAAQ